MKKSQMVIAPIVIKPQRSVQASRGKMKQNIVESKDEPDLEASDDTWKEWLFGVAKILNESDKILAATRKKADQSPTFKHWLATDAQSEIAKALNLSKSKVQRYLGDYAAEHKETLRKEALRLH